MKGNSSCLASLILLTPTLSAIGLVVSG